MTGRTDVAVIGAGPIGLAIAWRCVQRGLTVRVHDPRPPRPVADPAGAGALSGPVGVVGTGVPAGVSADRHRAWPVSAGMLAAVSEASFGEEALTGLLVESAARWPGFAAELVATGVDIGYRTGGSLIVALTADDLAVVRRLVDYRRGLELPLTTLPASALREREPLLAPWLRGGAYAPQDHQVDPRRLVVALYAAAVGAGATVVPVAVRDLSTVDAGTVVVAAGCGSAALTGLPVRPVKGQILRLRAPDGAAPGIGHVVRGYAAGRDVYLVPRSDGEVVVGATVEERTDADVTAGGVFELLHAATDLVPQLAEYHLVEVGVGHRPGTPDNAPLLGLLDSGPADAAPGRPRVIVATGHYRHGVLLAPVTADAITALVETGKPPALISAFSPNRYVRARA